MTIAVLLIGVLFLPAPGHAFPFGPKYPVTASWFRDRFTYQEWNRTLAEFQQQGGDTVFLRAPPIVRRTREDLVRDQDFHWCGSSHSSTGVFGTPCYDEAVEELKSFGLNVTALMTYEYEEGFSEAIMLCPRVDRKINSSRIYYRIVLPAEDFDEGKVCDFPSGTDVVVLFTSFAGTDPHSLLLSAAAHRNMSVYFGLPAAPLAADLSQHAASSRGLSAGHKGHGAEGNLDQSLMGAYYGWVYRVLHEHQVRYSRLKVKAAPRSHKASSQSLYDKALTGYYSTDECCLAQVEQDSPFVSLYTRLGQLVHGQRGKKLAVSPYIDVNRSQLNATVAQHVQGFDAIANTRQVDVVAVQEGRGAGKGCYYWATQQNLPVIRVDKVLDDVLHYLDPNLKDNITFQEACSASNQEVFGAFEKSHDTLTTQHNVSFEFWLNVEAFEYLRDDPCLPLDPASSGMGELLNRASKARVDRALTVASAKVQKVISFAWDSDYTCTTPQHKVSLAAEIRAEAKRPIIANCSYHSPANKSIVVIGYNLEGMQQRFQPTAATGNCRYPVQVDQPLSAGPNQSVPCGASGGDSRQTQGGHSRSDGLPDGDLEVSSLDTRRAVSPGNASVSARLASFVDWPARGLPSPRLLAIAGFYYLGSGDRVRCFYCGVTLRNWRQNDDPWEMHVRFRFSCDYVTAIRGEHFMHETLIKLASGCSIASAPNGSLTESSTSASSKQPRYTSATTGTVPTPDENPGQGSPAVSSENPATTGEAFSSGRRQNTERSSAAVSSIGASSNAGGGSGPERISQQAIASGQPSAASPTTVSRQQSTASRTTVSSDQPAPRSTTRIADNQDEVTYLQRLQEANRRLRQCHTCRLCGDRVVDTIFLPCGHLCTCESCAGTTRECCLCHDRIRDTAHVYLD